eukprot:CAMPEP_0198572770 /NCGR_PEP_ID=MMETSP1462-20131121/112274_1 /TAXON_ID=1333877 /ORGANISM="Brandtodinium nutriculum, Strain RCC3387" /LENGTH=56 /DNA_ID=CAMNT_0044303935 /DNA_START=26 /DNA_END=193 /DNA_ORIENTATION=-
MDMYACSGSTGRWMGEATSHHQHKEPPLPGGAPAAGSTIRTTSPGPASARAPPGAP